MTEAEWLACTDPTPMLVCLPGKPSDRKLRLFACACCRRVWHLLTDSRSRAAIVLAEDYAEGMVTEQDWSGASEAARKALEAMVPINTVPETDLLLWPSKAAAAGAVQWLVERSEPHDYVTRKAVQQAALFAAHAVADEALPCGYYNENHDQWQAVKAVEQSAQVGLLRCILGNPFYPVLIDPAWRTLNVVRLANTIYVERAFDRMPALANALEEVGCDNADILNHCRQPGVHVRGCWVVDVVLGKE